MINIYAVCSFKINNRSTTKKTWKSEVNLTHCPKLPSCGDCDRFNRLKMRPRLAQLYLRISKTKPNISVHKWHHALWQLLSSQRILNVPPTSLIILITNRYVLQYCIRILRILPLTFSIHTGQVRIHTGQVRILPDKFGSCRLSVRRPLTRGQRAYIRRGGRSTNILFIPKR